MNTMPMHGDCVACLARAAELDAVAATLILLKTLDGLPLAQVLRDLCFEHARRAKLAGGHSVRAPAIPGSMMKESMGLFGKRWRFSAELRKPCTVYRWVARSAQAFVHESLELEQYPELGLRPGRVVVECIGPEDLQLLAMVRLPGEFSAPMFSMVAFVRELEPVTT